MPGPLQRIELELRKLLNRLGRPQQDQHPDRPFQRLPSNGLWEMESLLPEHGDRSGQPRPHHVRDSAVGEGLPANIQHLPITHPNLCRQAVEYLLDRYFPDSMHSELIEAIGFEALMKPANEILSSRQRDPHFRDNVIRAHESRCAILRVRHNACMTA